MRFKYILHYSLQAHIFCIAHFSSQNFTTTGKPTDRGVKFMPRSATKLPIRKLLWHKLNYSGEHDAN